MDDKQIEIPEEMLEWLRWEIQQADAKQRGDFRSQLMLRESRQIKKAPEFVSRDLDHAYRSGFSYGVLQTADYVSILYRKGGYVRPADGGLPEHDNLITLCETCHDKK